MKFYFFDTKITGINPHKDHIVRFGMIYGEYDQNTGSFTELKRISLPENFFSRSRYFKPYLRKSDHIEQYLNDFLAYMSKADYVIGHNVDFDKKVIIAEAKRAGYDFDFDKIKWIDTMRPTTEFVNGKGGKWPKLIDLHTKLFGKGFDGSYDVMTDILATQACFLELIKHGFFQEIFEIWLWHTHQPNSTTHLSKYDEVDIFLDWYARVRLWDKRGLLNEDGEEISEIKYDDIEGGLYDYVKVRREEVRNYIKGKIYTYFKVRIWNKWGLLNGDWKKISEIKYDEISYNLTYSDPRRNPDGTIITLREWNKRGIRNEKMTSACCIKYDKISNFFNGYARVRLWKKRGLFNENWEEISEIKYDKIEFRFDSITWFYRVRLWKKRGFISDQGEEICEFKYDKVESFSVWYAKVKIWKKRGIINEQWEEICKIKYDHINYFFSNWHAGVSIWGKRGFINEQWEEICEIKYDQIAEDDWWWNLLNVSIWNKRGAINQQGKEICEIKYDQIYDLYNWYARVIIWEKHGFMDQEGKEIGEIKYDQVEDFYNWYAKVKIWDKRGFINKQWEEICKIEYDKVGTFQDWYAEVQSGRYEWEIDTNGKEFRLRKIEKQTVDEDNLPF